MKFKIHNLKLKASFAFSWLTAVLAFHAAAAEDVYYHVRIADLQFSNGALPKDVEPSDWQNFPRIEQMEPYAVLDGGGEVFLDPAFRSEPWQRPHPSEHQALEIRVAEGKEVSGRLFLPKPDLSGMVGLAFTASTSVLKPSVQHKFLEAEAAHYRELSDRDIPGGAWFRHQEQEAATALGQKRAAASATRRFWRPHAQDNLDETFGLFAGGRAVSENLQMDRALLATKPGDETEALTNLTGITVKPMDWKPLLAGAKPTTDTLAAFVPADQHAIFFPSFEALTQMLDEADGNGTPLLQLAESRAEDMDCRGRYQRQLCLGLNEISRRLGPHVIKTAAFTGSDPYLRIGTDVGVLFETSQLEILKTFILARQSAAMQGAPEVKGVQGQIDGVAYVGVVSQDRSISSYVASSGNVVFVCNSLYQLGRLIGTTKGKTPALLSQDEYLYFRTRYPLGSEDESALLVLPDAAIRRWCGARWRIVNSRRTRAAALLADIQAAHLDALIKGGAVYNNAANKDFPDGGTIQFTARGVLSSVYGNLDFLTPIGEMKFDHATKAEADAYNRWRDGYEQNWTQSFDPIAVRFSLHPERIGVEITVMPLILGTEYREFLTLSTGAGIAPAAGDPHEGALAHLALSINAKSAPFEQGGGFLVSMAPGISPNPLGWMGQSIALYADEDPFWEKLEHAPKKDAFMEKNYPSLPVALRCEVKEPLRLAAFLTALHGFADQSAPGMAVWENHEYKGQSYVKIFSKPSAAPDASMENLNIFYAASPRALTVTLNEDVLKRALDREAERAAALKDGKTLPAPALPWLGTNLCLKIDKHFLTAMQEIISSSSGNPLQTLSWNNLPVLNEWKRRFPNEDPVKLHEKYWQTKLLCPGGGSYVWNEKWQTMESTVYGSPAEPRDGPKLGLFPDMKTANLGLSFENGGLTAKAAIDREAKPH